MIESKPRRPPVPSPAARAKTIASRGGPAVLLPAAQQAQRAEGRVTPVLHHVHCSASVSVLLTDGDPLVLAAEDAERGEVAVVLELTDRAPVELREPMRGLLWITGWLRPLEGRAAKARAVSIADVRPDPRLLDVGHGLKLLRLTPASVVLADPDGTHSLRPHMFGSASPDPFCAYETQWLRHLEHMNPEVVDQLVRHLPDELRAGRVRPLGLDRFGLRLRVESAGGDHDVRLAFSRAVETPPQHASELRRLMGCPFLHRAL